MKMKGAPRKGHGSSRRPLSHAIRLVGGGEVWSCRRGIILMLPCLLHGHWICKQ
ncbi:hypothetical protein MUK42_17633 [Musa troglodytarum]|uniref:Uncharacterized protein n=1 Tax=Musa troglodytarum TaxID=320322 RepID=A0A9E7HFL4_9LILI|nr:hypothetical protein MUK42_17633 [Musa troglodytarum]